ncbi:MAG: MBL fold metallo-hydrolase [Proteobacteria bacterium]|nr:MBL fold metallo-hydrolase [Pseudomonadota bacterium]
MSINKLILSTMCGSLLGVFTFQGDAHAYRNTFGTLDNDRCAIFDDSERPDVSLPYGSGHPMVDFFVPDRSKGSPTPDLWTGDTISVATGTPTYHKGHLGGNVWYITEGVYQMMVIVGDSAVIVVDAPPSIGMDLNAGPFGSDVNVTIPEIVAEITDNPITKLIYSHSHFDHIGAAGVIKEAFPDVLIIAHKLTKEQLAQGSTNPNFLQPRPMIPLPDVPLPDKVFKKNRNISVGGGMKLELSYKGPAHEPGNIFIYQPDEKILMMIDIVFPRLSPFELLAMAEDTGSYLRAYDQILGYDFDVLIAGHLNALGTRDDVEEAREYMQDILANSKVALDPFDPLDPNSFPIGIAGPTFFGTFVDAAFIGGPEQTVDPSNGLGVFSLYLNQAACKCANLTLNPATTPSGIDWRSQIGTADVNTLSHCWKMIETLRVEPGFDP